MTLKNISEPHQGSRLSIVAGVVDGELVVGPRPVLDAVVAAARLLSHLDRVACRQLLKIFQFYNFTVKIFGWLLTTSKQTPVDLQSLLSALP